MLDEVFEFVPEMAQEALDRPGRGFAEGTDGMTFDLAGSRFEQFDILGPALALGDALEHPVHPAGAFPARRALAA